jgi:NADH-quinone oxidoreductase subunit G
MRVWFLKETRSLCTSCGTGCNITVGSRENVIHRFEPRENDAVNAAWMCDAGRLNYKWIGRRDRLDAVKLRAKDGRVVDGKWADALERVVSVLRGAARGSVAMIASGRQTNEELYLLRVLAGHVGALTDMVPRVGAGDALLVHADKNPNTTGARLVGWAPEAPGSRLQEIARGVQSGAITTLMVFGEDVTRHGISPACLGRLETLIVSDILPSATTALADILLPGCAHAEKRGTMTNVKGRVQKFLKAVEAPGAARPEWEFLEEWVRAMDGTAGAAATLGGWFNRMAAVVPAFLGLTWAGLGNTGATVRI